MSKKKQVEKRKKTQYNRLLFIGLSAVVFVILIGIVIFMWSSQLPKQDPGEAWSIDNSTGKLVFPARGPIDGSATFAERGDNYTLEDVSFKSFGDDVYALLRKPTNVTNPPVVIVMPAATITKEADEHTAIALCNMGYATLTLDARGLGQTGGIDERDWQSGFDAYVNGTTPTQYKQVYDALKALDYVKSRSDLDGSDVAILGESIGGMWAIVAAGEEPQFKGVVTISSSDFDLPDSNTTDSRAIKFISAVMPSKFAGSLPPRKLAMFQFDQDNIVPMGAGKALYDNVSEPKAWHLYNGSTHGLWDPAYASDLHDELKGMLGR